VQNASLNCHGKETNTKDKSYTGGEQRDEEREEVKKYVIIYSSVTIQVCRLYCINV
jgi:hypothetical protein